MQNKIVNNINSILKKCAFIIILVILNSNSVRAEDPQVALDTDKFSTAQGNPSGVENYDARSGSISFEIPIVSLPGPNGLNAAVSISFNKTSYALLGAEYWSLEVPKLVTPDGFSGLCNNSVGYGPLLVLPGVSPKQFFKQQNSPFTASNNMTYMTADKWTLTCQQSPNTPASNKWIDYLVRSPDGLIYKFYHQPAQTINGYRMFPNSSKLIASNNNYQEIQGEESYTLASSVSDVFGNTITYTYVLTPYTVTNFSPSAGSPIIQAKPQISKISFADGRSINFTYVAVTTPLPQSQYSEVSSHLTKITTDTRSWNFNYTNCFDTFSIPPTPVFGGNCAGNRPLLQSIQRPDGKLTTFKYQYIRTGVADIKAPQSLYLAYRPGFNFVVTEIDYPNGLVSSFGYNLASPNFTMMTAQPATLGTLSYQMSSPVLISRTRSGPGITSPITWAYQYLVTTSDMSYNMTFELGPSKMLVSKYRKNNLAFPKSTISSISTSTSGNVTTLSTFDSYYGGVPFGSIDSGMLIERAILPLPPAGTIALQSPQQSISQTPPSIVFTNVSPLYQIATQPITINFVASGSNPIASATCAINSGTAVNCSTFTSHTLSTLAAGIYSLTVNVTDTAGLTASATTIPFTVGSSGVDGTTTQVTTSNDCSFAGSIVNNGSSVTAYQSSTASYSNGCSSQTRTCVNGVLTGYYSYNSCFAGPTAVDCTIAVPASTYPNGSHILRYLSNLVPAGQTCQSELQTCIDGSFTGSYTYSYCAVSSTAPAAYWPLNFVNVYDRYGSSSQPISVEYVSSNGAPTPQCAIDNGAFSTCPGLNGWVGWWTLPVLSLGTHTLTIKIVDSAGIAFTAKSVPFTIYADSLLVAPTANFTAAATLKPDTVSASKYSSCRVTPQATAQCWGDNTYGQIGNNSILFSNTPAAVSNLTNVTKISASGEHTCAVNTSGQAYCWGRNDYMQIGLSSSTYPAVALPSLISGVSGVVAVATASRISCALTSGNAAYCWGYLNSTTTTGTPTLTLSGVKSIAIGNNGVCGITTTGGLTCNTTGYPTGLTGLTRISSSGLSTCATTSAGTVLCWGDNRGGELGNLANGTIVNPLGSSATAVTVLGITNAVDVTVGYLHACALLKTGDLKCWGDNSYGQLGVGYLAPKGSAQVAYQFSVAGITGGITSISSGYYHTCANTDKGTTYCWGYNSYGQLGDGDGFTASIPMLAPPLTAPTIALGTVSGTYAYTAQPISITFSASAPYGVIGYLCSVDYGAFTPCTTANSFTLPTLAAGTHTITVEGIDFSGNVGSVTSSPFVVLPPTTSASCTAGTVGTCTMPAASSGTTPAGTCPSGYTGACSSSCNNGTWSVATNTCTAPAASCTFNGTTVASGSSVTAYLASSVPYGSTCSSQVRSCTNGVLSGTYAYPSCSVATAASCTAGAVGTCTMPAASSGTTPAGTCPSGYSGACTSSCTNGTWAATTNTCIAPANCSFGTTTITSGGTAAGYTSASVPYGSSCTTVATTVTCTNGVISPAGAVASCSPAAAANCTAGTVGTCTMPAASSGTTPAGTCPSGYSGACTSSCTNGTWAATTNTCTAPANCSFGTTTITSGGTAAGYTSASVPYGSSCTTVATTVTCTNGVISPAGAVASCSPAAAANCTAATVGTCTMPAASSGTTPAGTCPSGNTGSCSSTCSNGAWTASTNTCAPGSCTFNSSVVASGNSVTAYLASSTTGATVCSSQSRTCTNGSLSGSYAYSTCNSGCLSSVIGTCNMGVGSGGVTSAGVCTTGYTGACSMTCNNGAWTSVSNTCAPSGGGGGSGCFVAGTLVTMADGTRKPIEEIKAGESVLAYNENTRSVYISKVQIPLHHEAARQTLHHFTLEDGRKFTSNAIHRIFVIEKNDWLESQQIYSLLQQGQTITLASEDGSNLKVKSIQLEDKFVPVYNLEVEGLAPYNPKKGQYGAGHSYYVNGILVHNAKL